MILVLDHPHDVYDVCSRFHCEFARRNPVFLGGPEHSDIPMIVLRKATKQQYFDQPLPAGWCIPHPSDGCKHVYEVLQGPMQEGFGATSGNFCTIATIHPTPKSAVLEGMWAVTPTPEDSNELRAWMVTNEMARTHEGCVIVEHGEDAIRILKLALLDGLKQ